MILTKTIDSVILFLQKMVLESAASCRSESKVHLTEKMIQTSLLILKEPINKLSLFSASLRY